MPSCSRTTGEHAPICGKARPLVYFPELSAKCRGEISALLFSIEIERNQDSESVKGGASVGPGSRWPHARIP